MCRSWIWIKTKAKYQYSKWYTVVHFKIRHCWTYRIECFLFSRVCPICIISLLDTSNLGLCVCVCVWRPLKGCLAVHARYLFLKGSADVSASTFQRGGEKAVGDAERLWMQVEVLHLKEKRRTKSHQKSVLKSELRMFSEPDVSRDSSLVQRTSALLPSLQLSCPLKRRSLNPVERRATVIFSETYPV